MVRFKHEAPQQKSRTVDIGIHGIEEVTFVGPYGYSIYEPFMVVEAKRLPAPSKDREREYVSGIGKATGGIQRFKCGQHGANVEIAVIIGYIEDQSVDHWHATINRWISELVAGTISDGCTWKEAELLEKLTWNDKDRTSASISFHGRFGECLTRSIRIHHVWVVMSAGRL